jgi:hypothetical protein
MNTQLATTPVETSTLAKFEHCLEVAKQLIGRRQAKGELRAPDDEPQRPAHWWQSSPPNPASDNRFVVQVKPGCQSAGRIRAKLFDRSLEGEFASAMRTALGSGVTVTSFDEDGVLVLEAFHFYP